MSYPGRSYPRVLPEFVGTAGTRSQTPEMRVRLIEHCRRRYIEDLASLRVLSAETGRSQTAVRRALSQAGVQLRGPGAPKIERD